ncbi:MAG TPA: MobF family relaxase [Acidimicrobiales bacterium]|nr:MobF family relaxase [Acidimicrobiales bacterium]
MPDVIVGVTVLGSRHGDAATAVAKVVAYLDGRSGCAPGRTPQWWDEAGVPDAAPCAHGLGTPAPGAVAYYADSVEGPGRWLGRGIVGYSPTGTVARADFEAVLAGRDPRNGRQLLEARGSAARAHHGPDDVAGKGPDDELLTMRQAATLLGVSPQYLRRLAGATARARLKAGNVAGDVAVDVALEHPYLDAVRAGPGKHWRVARSEVRRFATARSAPTAVIGYDVTFSAPKSVSLLWAQADPAGRAEIVAAIDEAVGAGVAYLQEHAAWVRTMAGPRRAAGVLAASYLHATSRALDPQLHAHVVVANMAEGPGGQVRALDGRHLFAHAKTAGYLAAAELRHQLARRLGVAWEAPERGVADIAGVPEAAVRAMSKRAEQINEVVSELERFFAGGRRIRARGRQVAAYLTRAAKEDHGVDPTALQPWWESRLAGAGFGPKAARRCLGRQRGGPAPVSEAEVGALFTWLGSPVGITETQAAFGRRDVLQHVAEWAGDRLGATDIAALADAWLATDVVVRLEPGRERQRPGDVVRLRDGRTLSAVADEALFTTKAMLAVEQRLLDAYARGRDAGAAMVPTPVLESALARRPELGADQVAMVRSVCTSGHRVQCVLGPAGSGKTFALSAAARAWSDAGYVPIGAAVQGTATEVLRDATGMPCFTVADLLTRLHHDVPGTLSERHVVLVDESSTLGNRDLAALAAHVEGHGATLRLIGDPAQHTAVAAGGGWRALLERYPEDRAELVERRRQAGEEMAEVRMAAVQYASGQISAAIERLRRDDRVVEADSPDELLDALVADWFVDRLRHQADPRLPASSMMADRHVERRELNRRARALLAAQGHLRGRAVEVGGQCFQRGDEVIDVQQDRDLFPRLGRPRDRVRTGERGVVVEVRPGRHPVVVVDFERRGRVEIGEAFLTRRVRPGVVGVITHSYAVTTHMAQGDTYEAGRPLVTDWGSREGVYVGLTRGRSDVRLYVVRGADLHPRLEDERGMPRLEEDTNALVAVTHHLRTQTGERLASELDHDAAAAAELQRAHSLAELAAMADGHDQVSADLARRAYRQAAAAVAAAARQAPDPALVARLGPRPEGGPERASWDRAVGAVAVHRERFDAAPEPGGLGATWAIGRPAPGPHLDHHEAVAEVLVVAERAILRARPVSELASEREALLLALAASPPGTNVSGQVADSPAAFPQVAGIGPDRALMQERLALVEGVLDDLVEAAVAHPAPYLLDAVPPCPSEEWTERARAIEGYRHRELGLSQDSDCIAGGSGLVGAIGPRPDAVVSALQWDAVVEAVELDDGSPAVDWAPTIEV